MNKDDVIRMAREAFIKRGFWPNEVMWECWKDAWIQGAAAEREACAKVAETPVGEYEVIVACGTEPTPRRIPRYLECHDIAKAIRARGQA